MTFTRDGKPAVVTIDDNALVVDGKRISRRSLRGGWIEPRADGSATLTFERRGRNIVLGSDLASASALLEAAGFGSGSTWTTSRHCPSQLATLVAVIAPLVILGFSAFVRMRSGGVHPDGWMMALMLAEMLVIALPVLFLVSRRRVTVGTDGIVLKRTFSRRFIRHDDVRGLVRKGTSLQINVRGEDIALLTPAALPLPAYRRQADALQQHLALAYQRREAQMGRGQAGDAAWLARGTRSASEWVAALRAITSGPPSYRAGAPSREVLTNVLEDANADPSVRVGAAVALRVAGDDAAMRQIRVAAAATAEPNLRAAFEEVLEDDDSLEERIAKMRVLSTPNRRLP